jgi:hypothetical protein
MLRAVTIIAAGAAAITLTTTASAVAASTAVAGAPAHATHSWGTAVELRGTAKLNQGGSASLNSVSCGAAGSCAAGGSYTDGSGHGQAFVATEVKGRWHAAVEVPGTAALNSDGNAEIDAMSCAAAGSCAAGGNYTDGSDHGQVFVVTEVKGRWGRAVEVPGTAKLNAGGDAELDAVSCGAAGTCAASGSYTDGSGQEQAFVVTEVKGRWHAAVEVPGTAALNAGGNAHAYSVSCAAGICAAGGNYLDGSGREGAFVTDYSHGRWHGAIEPAGAAAHGGAGLDSVSCTVTGNCTAGGSYLDSSGRERPLVLTELKGRWHFEAPGTTVLHEGGTAYLLSVSCAAAGSCAAGGGYEDRSGDYQALAVTEVKGRWGKTFEVPGTAALNKGGGAYISSLSCAVAGSCVAVGNYTDESDDSQAFIVTEAKGRWAKAIEVPGTATLNKGGHAYMYSVSCAAAGTCAAGGSYKDGSDDYQAFILGKS